MAKIIQREWTSTGRETRCLRQSTHARAPNKPTCMPRKAEEWRRAKTFNIRRSRISWLNSERVALANGFDLTRIGQLAWLLRSTVQNCVRRGKRSHSGLRLAHGHEGQREEEVKTIK